MDKAQFTAIMPHICAGLVDVIAQRNQVDERTAISMLYDSLLYTFLEDEESKVWHYSVPMLYQLWEEGEANGKIEWPDT